MSILSNPLHRGFHVGIELEYEGVDLFRMFEETYVGECSYWSLDSDGSLRDGVELISSPLSMPAWMSAREELDGILERYDTDTSHRCSTHVHLNVSDLSKDQFESLLYLCLCLEPLLMEYCSPFRHNSNFCMPTYNSVNLIDQYRRTVSLVDTGSYNFDFPKYSAMSLYRLPDLGTIEFRMFEGINDTDRLDKVIQLIHQIYTIGTTRSVSQLKDNKVQQGVQTLLTPLLSDIYQQLIPQGQLESVMEKGIRMANDMIRKDMTVDELLGKHKELFPDADAYKKVEVNESIEGLTYEQQAWFITKMNGQPTEPLDGAVKAKTFVKFVEMLMAAKPEITEDQATQETWDIITR